MGTEPEPRVISKELLEAVHQRALQVRFGIDTDSETAQSWYENMEKLSADVGDEPGLTEAEHSYRASWVAWREVVAHEFPVESLTAYAPGVHLNLFDSLFADSVLLGDEGEWKLKLTEHWADTPDLNEWWGGYWQEARQVLDKQILEERSETPAAQQRQSPEIDFG